MSRCCSKSEPLRRPRRPETQWHGPKGRAPPQVGRPRARVSDTRPGPVHFSRSELSSFRGRLQGRPGETRPLGIPVVRDRVVQTAAKLVLEPIFEASFLPGSYGFRPKRTAHEALESVRKEVNQGARWVVDIDFKDFFGSLDPRLLLGLVARRVSDRRVLRLVRMWI